MNFETMNRFHFEPIEKAMRSWSETIHIGKQVVTLTKAMYERMGNPERLLFAYDAEEKAVGIRVEEKECPNSVTVTQRKNGSVMVNNSKFICDKISTEMKVDLDLQRINLKRGYRTNEWFVFELRYAEVTKKIGRKCK